MLDSRLTQEGYAIRRRRECQRCGRRFTTFEQPERPRLLVVKRDGAREDFSREKMLNSMLIACRKRPVPLHVLRAAADWIERALFSDLEEEVSTAEIGERVMGQLRQIDPVAYVRFASVYREFQTVSDFHQIIESVREEPPIAPRSL